MAIVKNSVADSYVKMKGLNAKPDAGEIRLKVMALIDKGAMVIAKKYPWDWLENASETLTVGAGETWVTPSTLKTIKGIRLADKWDLKQISQDRFNSLVAADDSTSTEPSKYAKFSDKYYLYKVPSAGVEVIGHGLITTDTASTVLTNMPNGFEAILWDYIDMKFGEMPPNEFYANLKDAYKEQVRVETEEIKDDGFRKSMGVMISDMGREWDSSSTK